MRLTEDVLKDITKKKRPTVGQQILWDDLLQGFGARVTPTRVAYVVQWREADGRRPREGLRRFWPQTPVAEAREIARKKLAEVVVTTEGDAAIELRVAMRRWYERESDKWRPRYRYKVNALIAHFIEGEPSERIKLSPTTRAAIEKLGSRPVSSITRSDIVAVVDGLRPGAGEQLMAIGSSFCNSMLDRGVDVGNPFRNRLRRFGGRSVRNRVLSDDEVVKIWRALEKEGDPALGAFGLLVFTGCRRREITLLEWREVDLDRATITLPPERRKTGKRDPRPFVIHLHPMAVEIIRRQPKLDGNKYVFWGRRDRKPFDFQHALMVRLKSLGLPDWRLHDIRRAMRTGLGRLGVSQMVAELCLGHLTAKGGLVGVYDQYSYADEMRAAWQRWGDHVSSLVGGSRP